MTEVAIQTALEPMPVQKLVEIAKVRSQFFRSDSRILPPFPGKRLAGHVRENSKAGLANLPDALHLLLVGEEAHIGWSWAALQ